NCSFSPALRARQMEGRWGFAMVVNVGRAEGFANGQDGGHAHGHGPGGILAPLVRPLSRRIEHERAEPLSRRDREFIQRQLAPMSHYTSFFSPEVKGLGNLPASGPVLIVGNHSCLFYMPDAWVVGLAIVRRRGLDQPAYALVYD